MAKDIKVVKGNDDIIINETQLADFESRGYKQIDNKKPKINQKEKTWRPITEKKV